MKVLLFGSTGLLGTHLFTEFINQRWRVCAPRRDDINLADLNAVNNFVSSWLRNNREGFVVYAAGLTDITACHLKPGLAQHLNVLVPAIIANHCSQAERPFVYFSTDQVFASNLLNRNHWHDEDDSPHLPYPTGQVYGASKARGERLVRFDGRNIVIRTSWLFGDHPTRSNYVRDVVVQARARQPVIGLTDYVACPSYAPDVAKATVDLLSSTTPWGVYHLVNGPAVSRYEMAKTILYVAGLGEEVEERRQNQMGPDWIPRNSNGGLSVSRCPKLRPWTDGLHEYLQLLHTDTIKTPA